MSGLVLGTNAVSMDEPAFSLKEILGPALDSKGVRRWQALKIVRGNELVEFRRDLGPASKFRAREFAIPGGAVDPSTGRIGIVETVGRLMDIADFLRSDQYEAPEPTPVTDLIQGYQDLYDKRKRNRKRLSVVGPQVRVQRS